MTSYNPKDFLLLSSIEICKKSNAKLILFIQIKISVTVPTSRTIITSNYSTLYENLDKYLKIETDELMKNNNIEVEYKIDYLPFDEIIKSPELSQKVNLVVLKSSGNIINCFLKSFYIKKLLQSKIPILIINKRTDVLNINSGSCILEDIPLLELKSKKYFYNILQSLSIVSTTVSVNRNWTIISKDLNKIRLNHYLKNEMAATNTISHYFILGLTIRFSFLKMIKFHTTCIRLMAQKFPLIIISL